MQITINRDLTLVVENCIKCGTAFGIEATRQQGLLRSGDTFYCPNGHPQVYSKPIEQQLKETQKALADEKRLRTNAEQDAHFWQGEAETNAKTLSTTKQVLKNTRGQLTRTKKRIAAGICPECRRSFENLHRHMQHKHPDYVPPEQGSAPPP